MAGADFTPFPTVQPTGAPSDYEKVNVNPEEFGSAIGQAEEGAGAKIEGAGKEIFQSAMMQAELTNELNANDANTQATKQMGKMYGDYTSLKGEAAVKGLDGYTDSITSLYKSALAAAPNLKARALLSASMRYMGDRYINYGQMYAKEQHTSWQNQSASDAADEHMNQAVLAAVNDDPKGMDASLQAGAQQQVKIAEQNGLDDTGSLALQHKWMGTAVSDIVRGTIAEGNLDKAKEIYNRYKDQMDARGQVLVETALKPAMLDQLTSSKANAAVTPAYGPAPAGFTDLEKAHGLPAGYLTGTYGIESNFGRNLGSGKYVKGPFQFDAPTAKSVGLDDPMDLNKSAEGAARLGEKNMKLMEPYLGRAPSAGELYIAHQQGASGAVSLLTHPDATAASLVGADKIAANLPASMKGLAETITARQFTQYWEGHFGGEASGFVGRDAPTPATSTYAPESIAIDRLNSDPELAQNPAALSKAIAKTHQIYSNWNAENKTTIDELNHNVPSLISQIESGDGDIDQLASQYPQEAVRNYLPSKAQEWEQEIGDAQKIGTMIQGYKWESNENVVAAWQDLKGGHGPISEMIAKDATDPWEHARLVGLGTRKLESVLKERDAKMLGPNADPASYVMGNPVVNEAAKGINPTDPKTYENYALKTLNQQASMGVPDQYAHVLTREQAQAAVQHITANTGDAKAAMDLVAKSAGRAWPQVFSDLVALGKLPVEYQGLQVLTDKSDLATYTQALGETKKDDFGGWENALGMGDKTEGTRTKTLLDVGVQTGLAPYVNSLRMSGAGDKEINDVTKAVNLLAYGNKYFKNSSDPVGEAVKSFIGQFQYMNQGGARVPAAAFDTVNSNAYNMLQRLTPDDIRLPNQIGQPGMPSKEAYMAQLQSSPEWVTAPRGDSIILRDMMGKAVLGNDGNPLAVMFSGVKPYSDNIAPKVPPPGQLTPEIQNLMDTYKRVLINSGNFTPSEVEERVQQYSKTFEKK